MNPPTTGKTILAVLAGICVMALCAALVFLLMETIFEAAERTGDKNDKYRIFSSRAGVSFYTALVISAFAGALVCLAIARVRRLNLALLTVFTPLAIITLSMLFDKEAAPPDEGLLFISAALCAGATLAWLVKKKDATIDNNP